MIGLEKTEGFGTKKDFAFYRKLFTSTFYLSAFTFGGGYVIIPLMRKKFVEQFHWIEETEMLDLTAIAQSAPGPIAVNASILIGYRLAGFAGAMVSTLGTVLPPLIILSLISLAYTAFQSSLIVKLVLRGMQAGVAAVIADVVISMGGDVLKQKRWLPILIMLGSFAAACFFHVNVMLIIIVCALIGLFATLHDERNGKAGA